MGSDEPVISVVIPHLNQPENLRACLASLEAQRGDGVPFEVIVVDNGSPEPPAAVCADFGGVRLEVETTPGPGPARSHGAGLARGGILAFIDSDCTADPGWFSAIAAYFRRKDAADALGGQVRIAPVNPEDLTMVEAFESVYGYRMKLFIERDNYAATCNMAVRREVFEKVGPFAGINVAEDMDWGQRATAMGYRIEYVPEIGIHTPARENFADLTRKWDRHIAHDFEVVPAGIVPRLKWLLRAAALAASPLAEIPTIARTGYLSGFGDRLLCLRGVVRIRWYRAWKMLQLAFGADGSRMSGGWHQTGGRG
ncbi:glycosyltransferase [Amaricoccus tamworthensis]|uniref:glycosyltransferase n=1 Tax=Amaricoccus tamworthensis TaxID=57002 RepID=UPI003C7C124C